MPAAVWDADFVGVWHLVDGHDSTAHNASTNNGGTTIPGQLGPALHFDGASHYVDTASTAVLAQWTIEAWANPTNPATYNPGNASAIIGQFPNYLMLWDCYTNGFCHTVLYNDTVGGPTHYASYNLSTGTFTHVAGRFDGANVETYVAGARVGQTASTAAPGASVSTDKIGARESGPYYFIGAIDEVRISRIARSPDYLAATVRAGTGTYVNIGNELPN
jgi:biopolymer transport protein ExbB